MPTNDIHLAQLRFLADAPRGQVAVLRLHLSTGEVLRNRVITCDPQGRLLQHSPLTAETVFCKWYRGDWYEI